MSERTWRVDGKQFTDSSVKLALTHHISRGAVDSWVFHHGGRRAKPWLVATEMGGHRMSNREVALFVVALAASERCAYKKEEGNV